MYLNNHFPTRAREFAAKLDEVLAPHVAKAQWARGERTDEELWASIK